MKQITGADMHLESLRQGRFTAEYRVSLSGIRYSGIITLDGCRPCNLSGLMSWTFEAIPPGRSVERIVRESIQYLDIEKLLIR